MQLLGRSDNGSPAGRSAFSIPTSWLKPALFALGTIMVAAFAVYTHIVIRALRDDARRVAEVYAEIMLPRVASDPSLSDAELKVLFDLIREMPIGVVITDHDGEPHLWRGISIPDTARSGAARAEVKRIAAAMDRVTPPREVFVPLGPENALRWNIHVAESQFLRRIAWMPVVASLVTLIFTGIALWGFMQIKTGEQQALWVGMAKETAHQLGTPLSSIGGWLELLAEDNRPLAKGRRRSDEIIAEMSHDLERLRRIAQRFSQVGSQPELHPQPITQVIDETVTYFRTRLPQLGKDLTIERDYRADDEVPLNRELLGWAFENLMKNSLDAFPRGQERPVIRITSQRVDRWVRLLIEDNGKGISPQDLRNVFEPGYSTKQRGWGLGLTFVKRIVEDYHGGRIAVHSAGHGRGTLVEIRLPISR